jgi:hypothetical protein
VTDTWTEPCDTAQPPAAPSRCGWLDLLKQIPDADIGRIEDIHVALEGVL